jgi:hypothetical protein
LLPGEKRGPPVLFSDFADRTWRGTSERALGDLFMAESLGFFFPFMAVSLGLFLSSRAWSLTDDDDDVCSTALASPLFSGVIREVTVVRVSSPTMVFSVSSPSLSSLSSSSLSFFFALLNSSEVGLG